MHWQWTTSLLHKTTDIFFASTYTRTLYHPINLLDEVTGKLFYCTHRFLIPECFSWTGVVLVITLDMLLTYCGHMVTRSESTLAQVMAGYLMAPSQILAPMFTLDHQSGPVAFIFTRTQFWPSGIVVACVSVSVCVSLACLCDNSGPFQARITKFRRNV